MEFVMSLVLVIAQSSHVVGWALPWLTALLIAVVLSINSADRDTYWWVGVGLPLGGFLSLATGITAFYTLGLSAAWAIWAVGYWRVFPSKYGARGGEK